MRYLPTAIAVIAALFLVACSSSSGNDETPTPAPTEERIETATASPTETPTSDPEADFPALTPFSAELEAKLHEIRDRVAEIRGLPINTDAKEGSVTNEALAQYGREPIWRA